MNKFQHRFRRSVSYFSKMVCIFVFVVCFATLDSLAQSQPGRNVFERKKSDAPSQPGSGKRIDDATRQRMRQLGQEFSSSTPRHQNNYYFAIFFVFLFAVTGGLIYFDYRYRQRMRHGFDDAWALFRELCREHGMTRTERHFLKLVADELELDDPLPLFIEPQHLMKALENEHLAEHRKTTRYMLRKLFEIRLEQEPFRDGESSGTQSSIDATTVIHPGFRDYDSDIISEKISEPEA